MSKTQYCDYFYHDYLYACVGFIEEYCQERFNCGPFASAYRCRRFLELSGYSGVKVVRLSYSCYLPMTSEVYRDWRRYQRLISALDAK